MGTMFKHKTIPKMIAIVIVVVVVLNVANSLIQSFQISRNLTRVEDEIVALQEEKDRLEVEKAYKNSPEFIEQEARDKLNLVKPGDTLVDFISNSDNSNQTKTKVIINQQNIPFLWQDLLMGRLN